MQDVAIFTQKPGVQGIFLKIRFLVKDQMSFSWSTVWESRAMGCMCWIVYSWAIALKNWDRKAVSLLSSNVASHHRRCGMVGSGSFEGMLCCMDGWMDRSNSTCISMQFAWNMVMSIPRSWMSKQLMWATVPRWNICQNRSSSKTIPSYSSFDHWCSGSFQLL